MGKVKEQMLLQQEEEFELDLSYAEWLRDNMQEPSEDEILEMELDFLTKPNFCWTRSITQKSLNNTNYKIGERL